MCISFFTERTPPTASTTFTACSMSAAELANPLSCTAPLNVSTLISLDFKEASLKIAAFTLVVMAVSSMY